MVMRARCTCTKAQISNENYSLRLFTLEAHVISFFIINLLPLPLMLLLQFSFSRVVELFIQFIIQNIYYDRAKITTEPGVRAQVQFVGSIARWTASWLAGWLTSVLTNTKQK